MKSNWCSCNGTVDPGAPVAKNEQANIPEPVHPFTLTRRQALFGASLAALAWATRGPSALADIAVSPKMHGTDSNILVTIFLRGGADGLSLIVPHGEDAYYRNRPTLGIAHPIDLDGFFGLHPALSPLYPHYRSGQLAIVHACGSNDHTRSHFEAMATIEGGAADEKTGGTSGWLARHLNSTAGRNNSPLRAVALSCVMPDSLRGAPGATALNSLADFQLGAGPRRPEITSSLAALYGTEKDEIARAGRETLQVLDSLNHLAPQHYKPAPGAAYPGTDLGTGLCEVACLIKANLGLEAACLDRGGWDTHVAQGGGSGFLAAQIEDLAKSLAAFHTDLGRQMKNVIVVVMTEFGRRLAENGGLGTDHGRAGAMLLLGGGVRGGQVYARWPGLETHQLESPGDLRVTTDYRDVLSEIISHRLNNTQLGEVFPKYEPRILGIISQDIS